MTRKSVPAARMTGAGKWITATITTGAALAALLVNARNLGMNQWLGLADYSARRVWVTPRVDTLLAVGDTTVLAAAVTDERGASLTGVTLKWRSADMGVATVDSAGTVVARGPGVAIITASVRDVGSEARIVVRQVPVRVAIPGDSVLGVLEGDTLRFVALTLDARDHPIRAMPPHWQSGDSGIVAVDSMGRALARAPGWASLTAVHGRFEARIAVQVELAPAAISLLAGADQHMPAGSALPRPVVARITSRSGTPIPDVPVAFIAADGEGAVEPDTATSDHDGEVQTRWTLSARAGRQHLLVTTPALDSALVVTAEADPIPGNTNVTPRDTLLAGPVGDSLGGPVVVRAADSTGAALVDVPVSWTSLDRGTVHPIDERTDSVGEARAWWILGPRAGRQRLRVQVGNPRTIPPVTISATATAAAPHDLIIASGQGQSGTVGRRLSKAVIVRVRDANGNGVPSARVSVTALQGTVADTATATDSTGHVAIQWDLGRKAGPHALEVRVPGVDATLRATSRARPATAANVAFQDPPTSGTAGTRLRIAALVTDAYGNPVSNAVVVFGARAGTLSASRVATDSAGRATTRWTPGRAAGEQTVTATLRGTTVTASHTARISAAPAKRD